MQTVNFQASPDFSAEAEDIARRRKYAELLQEQSMQPLQGQMAGRYYVAPSWTQGLNKAAQGLIGGYGERDAGERQKALAEKLRTQGAADTEAFMGALNGKPAQAPMTPNDDEGNPNPMIPAMPGDKRQALAVALGSQNPMVKQAGSALLAQMLKAEEPYNLRKDEKRYGPDGRVIASNEAPRTHVINGQVVRETENGIVPLGSPIPHQANPYQDLVIPDGKGGVMQNAPLVGARKDISQAGKTAVNVAVNSDKSYASHVAEGMAKQDVATIDAARTAGDRIRTAQSVKQILDKNPITGTGAEARLGLNKALATAGLIDGKQVRDTENLAGLLASSTLEAIKTSGLGAGQGFTDKDRQFLERAKSGNIEINAGTLRDLADLNERSARATIAAGKAVAKRLKENPNMGTVGRSLEFDEPAANTGGWSIEPVK